MFTTIRSCDDVCLTKIEVNDTTIKKEVLNYVKAGETVTCFDTSAVTNMDYLYYDGNQYDDENLYRMFNDDLSCWDVSSVTTMSVSIYCVKEYHILFTYFDILTYVCISSFLVDV